MLYDEKICITNKNHLKDKEYVCILLETLYKFIDRKSGVIIILTFYIRVPRDIRFC